MEITDIGKIASHAIINTGQLVVGRPIYIIMYTGTNRTLNA